MPTTPNSGTPIPKHLTVGEASDVLGVSKSHMYSLLYERRIPFHKIGRAVRISERDLSDYLEQHRIAAVEESE